MGPASESQEVRQMKVLMRLSLALAVSAPLAVLPPAHAETLIHSPRC
jgi:hypothetical protein